MTWNLSMIFGPMFSGKSTYLQNQINRQKIKGKKCIIINYKHDNRYCEGNFVVTHELVKMEAVKCDKLCDINVDEFDVIGIDEGQFFIDLVEMASRWSDDGKKVIVAALDATFDRKPFGNICDLIAMSDKVKKLRSICKICHKKALFNQRTVKDAKSVIGGIEQYRPLCRQCFIKEEGITNSLTASMESLLIPSLEETQSSDSIKKSNSDISTTKGSLSNARTCSSINA